MAQRQATLLVVVSYMKITLLVTFCPTVFSIFSAEFYTIEKALEIIASHHLKNFIIYADSKSVLVALLPISWSSTYTSVLEHYNEFLWTLKETKLLIKSPRKLLDLLIVVHHILI